MNRIPAHITNIVKQTHLTVITFEVNGELLTMMGLGFNVKAEVGDAVVLGVKATNITLAKNMQGEVSISNRLKCEVTEVENGSLFSTVGLQFESTNLECITLLASSERLALAPGDTVTALIKASELSILEVRK